MTASTNDDPLFADLATRIWRLRKLLGSFDTAASRPENRRPLREVDALLERLLEEGIEVQDHEGHLYDSTLSLRIAAFQPSTAITEERILETLKPTVYRKGERIQTGEVIVGIPENSSSTRGSS